VELRGEVPPRAVVVPGTRKRRFKAGNFRVPCALIIGERSASTDRKTSLTQALREHAVSV
jgi:2,3,4,5-tetrahydropyridine-2,6-dicarboxylate N-succinyltransferase